MFSYRRILFVIGIICLMILISVSGCATKTNKFDEINRAFVKSQNLLSSLSDPGIQVGIFSAQPNDKFVIGFHIDSNAITEQRFKQFIRAYLNHVASYTSHHDAQKLFKPYDLEIVSFGDLPILSKEIIAEKPAGSATINWIKNTDIFATNIKIDRDYINALNTADKFLGAWLDRDIEKGKRYLTKQLKDKLSEDDLFGILSVVSNPHRQGFEITGAKKIDYYTIRFDVSIYEYSTNTNFDLESPTRPLFIDIVKVSDDEWLVGQLSRDLRKMID